jgi:hypothetical protein
MNDFDIVLINVIIFMTGFGSGLGFCFKYKNHLIARSRSQEFQNNPLDPNQAPQAQPQGQAQPQINPGPPPVYPTAPVPLALGYPNSPQKREIVIRTTE